MIHPAGMAAASVILGNLLIGAAYFIYGLLAAWESFSLRRYRGWSRFGIGFALMGVTCGVHHLTHGWHVAEGAPVSGPILAVTVAGLLPALAFVSLRIETMLGGRGDRWFACAPRWAAMAASAFAAGAGASAAWNAARPAAVFPDGPDGSLCTAGHGASWLGIDVATAVLVANGLVSAAYGMVGWYLADYQVRRHAASGVWSLAGVSLSGVFLSCALMHLIDVTAGSGGVMLISDVLGIPSSIYFLWTVRQVHNDSVVDWNRRPLVGAAAAPERASPWRGGGD